MNPYARGFRRVAIWTAVASLASLCPVLIAEDTPAPLGQRSPNPAKPRAYTPGSIKDVARLRALMVEALAVRVLATSDLAKASGYPAADPKFFEFTKGSEMPETAHGPCWQAFFGFTVILTGHANSASPMIAYYNPWFDAAWLTVWNTEGGRPRIVRAGFVSGAGMAGEKLVMPRRPGWREKKMPVPAALIASFQEREAQFDRRFPLDAAAAIPAGQIEFEDDLPRWIELYRAGMVIGLKPLLEDLGTKAVIENFPKALGAADRAGLGALIPAANVFPVAELLHLPEAARKNLAVVFGMPGKGGGPSTVIFSSYALPTSFLSLEIDGRLRPPVRSLTAWALRQNVTMFNPH